MASYKTSPSKKKENSTKNIPTSVDAVENKTKKNSHKHPKKQVNKDKHSKSTTKEVHKVAQVAEITEQISILEVVSESAIAAKPFLLVFMALFCMYIALTLVSYNPQDMAELGSGNVENWGGVLGVLLSTKLYTAFGYGAWVTLPIGGLCAWAAAGRPLFSLVRMFGVLLLYWNVLCILSLLSMEPTSLGFYNGGTIGFASTSVMTKLIGSGGAWLLVGGLSVTIFIFVAGMELREIVEKLLQRLEEKGPDISQRSLHWGQDVLEKIKDSSLRIFGTVKNSIGERLQRSSTQIENEDDWYGENTSYTDDGIEMSEEDSLPPSHFDYSEDASEYTEHSYEYETQEIQDATKTHVQSSQFAEVNFTDSSNPQQDNATFDSVPQSVPAIPSKKSVAPAKNTTEAKKATHVPQPNTPSRAEAKAQKPSQPVVPVVPKTPATQSPLQTATHNFPTEDLNYNIPPIQQAKKSVVPPVNSIPVPQNAMFVSAVDKNEKEDIELPSDEWDEDLSEWYSTAHSVITEPKQTVSPLPAQHTKAKKTPSPMVSTPPPPKNVVIPEFLDLAALEQANKANSVLASSPILSAMPTHNTAHKSTQDKTEEVCVPEKQAPVQKADVYTPVSMPSKKHAPIPTPSKIPVTQEELSENMEESEEMVEDSEEIDYSEDLEDSEDVDYSEEMDYSEDMEDSEDMDDSEDMEDSEDAEQSMEVEYSEASPSDTSESVSISLPKQHAPVQTSRKRKDIDEEFIAEKTPARVTVNPGNISFGGAGEVNKLVNQYKNFKLPSIEMLDYHEEDIAQYNEEELMELADAIVDKLADFKVMGEVETICPGPVITTFEFKPARGVRVSKIATLADDIAMALKAVRVRIVAPIPGKDVVGIEIPNRERKTIWSRDMLGSRVFQEYKGVLPIALGKTVDGVPYVTDLAKTPHLLVAGTTGSGKSVGVNTMLVSLLLRHSPETLRLILVDPKKIEFSMYDEIPHLLHPVVTDPAEAAGILQWACNEMDRRYESMVAFKSRTIESYNEKIKEELQDWTAEKAAYYAPENWDGISPLPIPKPMPYIVVVIDELADLMMTAGKEVEESIARIAQKARACGIHLIVATQRPSADVVTGLIKANMPSRMCFQVRSRNESRIILDNNGGETLLGKGDMLYLPPSADLVRCHGPFLSDHEVQKITDHLRKQGKPTYEAEVVRPAEVEASGDMEYDDLYDQVVAFVFEKGSVSTSAVQRQFRIGYNRAASIVEQMEREGLISEQNGSKKRKILKNQLE